MFVGLCMCVLYFVQLDVVPVLCHQSTVSQSCCGTDMKGSISTPIHFPHIMMSSPSHGHILYPVLLELYTQSMRTTLFHRSPSLCLSLLQHTATTPVLLRNQRVRLTRLFFSQLTHHAFFPLLAQPPKRRPLPVCPFSC